ncbi:MAG: TolC family protein [Myxococcota bacterium]
MKNDELSLIDGPGARVLGIGLILALGVGAGAGRAVGQDEAPPDLGPAAELEPIDPVEDVRAAFEASKALEVSLRQALEIALVRSYVLNQSRLDVLSANQQVREAYGEIYPRFDVDASYTRQFSQLNPFAGSSAATLGGGSLTTEFLLENEAREEAGLDPIPFSEFAQVADVLAANASDNPFFVENRFLVGLTITQTLYDWEAFAAIDGAKSLKAQQRAGFRDQARRVVQDVSTAYYDVLLADLRAEVLRRSEARSEAEVRDARERVEQGVQPRFSLLTAEVQLANTETERLQAENDAETSEDQLKVLLGVPVALTLELTDELLDEPDIETPPSMNEAMGTAMENRPDLEQAELQIKLDEVEERIAFSDYLPTLELVFQFQAIGQVPDDRQPDPVLTFDPEPGPDEAIPPSEFIVLSQADTPAFFSNSFWGPNVTGAVVLSWNVFNGFQTSARVAQRRLQARRSRYARDLLRAQIEQEVASQIRNLRTSAQQIRSQNRNVERAKTNYEQARIRVQEGVSSQVELRDANEQLDDSRLNYLNALRDYRVARVQYLVAIGRPPLPGPLSVKIEDGGGGEKDPEE